MNDDDACNNPLCTLINEVNQTEKTQKREEEREEERWRNGSTAVQSTASSREQRAKLQPQSCHGAAPARGAVFEPARAALALDDALPIPLGLIFVLGLVAPCLTPGKTVLLH